MRNLFLIFAVLPLLAQPVSAEIIWSADPNKSTAVDDFFKRFDSGNYPQDYCVEKGDEVGVAPSTVSVVDDATYGKVWRIHKPIGRKRGELARLEGKVNSVAPKEGDDLYIAWDWKIDTADGKKITKETTVFQWKSQAPHNQNYPVNLEYDGDLTLNVWGPDEVGKANYGARRSVLWRKAVPQGEWVSLIVRIKVDKDDFGGLVEFWFNGEKQKLDNLESRNYKVKLSADKTTVYHRTNDGQFVYPKWGAYNKKSCEYDINAYFHDMRVGTTLESVLASSGE